MTNCFFLFIPQEVVDSLFCFIQVGVGQDKLPVDLGSLQGCCSLSDKKKVIFSLLSAALGKMDQDKAMDKRKKNNMKLFLSDYLRDKNDSIEFGDMLSRMEKSNRIDADDIEYLADVFGEIDEIGCNELSWGEVFEREKKILVLDLGNEVGDSSHLLLDIVVTSLFSWQQMHDSQFLTIAVDEVKDQVFTQNSPLRSIVTDGRRFHTALLGATQDYFDQRNPTLDALRQANIKSFGRPGKSEDKVAQTLEYPNAQAAGFNNFAAGDIIMDFDALNKLTGINESVKLRGRVVDFIETPLYSRFLEEYGNSEPRVEEPT